MIWCALVVEGKMAMPFLVRTPDAAPRDDEVLVRRVGKKINGKYALVTIFSSHSRVRLVVGGL